jgi:VCBS repeat-containing protein
VQAAVYNAGGTLQSPAHIVYGSGTLTGGTGSTYGSLTVTLSSSAAFSNTSSYVCHLQVESSSATSPSVVVTRTDGSHFTITEASKNANDAITYMCVGT